jgi:hypothetical protein
MPADTLDSLIARIRIRMSDLLASGAVTRDTALLLADLEEEQARRDQIDLRLQERADALNGAGGGSAGNPSVLDRPLPAGLDRRAGVPRTLRPPTAEEGARGVVVAWSNTNLTFYRAVIDRLLPDEKFRLETQHGTFEVTRDEFEKAVPSMVRSASYQRRSDAAPGAARYVTGRVPASISKYRIG